MWMHSTHGERLSRSSRGQSIVELAISLPLVMMLMMGVIDFGWVLYGHIQVASASVEGARVGAVFPADLGASTDVNDLARTQAVQNAIYDAAVSPPTSALGVLNATDPNNFNVDTDVQVTYPDPPDDLNNSIRRGQQMYVTVTYHQPVWFSILPGISPTGRIDVSTTTKVRIQ